jgi:hypothetical protein
MSATWRKVLTDANITGGVAAGNTLNLATGSEIAAAIAAASANAGAGDITEIAPFPNGGIIIYENADNVGGFSVGTATSGPAQIQVDAGDGITVDSGGVSVASTLAGNGLDLSSGIMTVDLGTNAGLQFDASNKLVARLDANTLHVDSTSTAIDIKDGGVQLVHLDPGMVYTTADTDSLGFTDDTKILTASAINDNFPNVTTAVGAETYVTMGAGQVLSVNEINIGTHTNLATAAAADPAVQGDVVISLSGSTLSANAINLGIDDAVTFAGVTSTTQLSVTNNGGASISGNVNIQGNLSVTGTTTTVNSTEVLIEDHVITLATTSSTPGELDASEAGLDVFTSSTEAHRPRFAWRYAQVSELTGWQIRGHNGSASNTTNDLVDIAVMDFNTGSPTSGAQSTDTSAGVGAFWFDSSTKDLYLRVS